ncbi:hypothetical protein GGF37_006551 [Kickxella alabastrina]|nr:hypothetical protein GGF37_006551 [Kickxella alabastrina]
MDFVSVIKLLMYLPGVEQLEFQLPDQHALPPSNGGSKSPPPLSSADNGRLSAAIAHNLEGRTWSEERARFAEIFAGKPHPLQSIIMSGYHVDLHSAAVTDFLKLFPDVDSLSFASVGREDHDNIDQLAGVLTALNPDLEVSII